MFFHLYFTSVKNAEPDKHSHDQMCESQEMTFHHLASFARVFLTGFHGSQKELRLTQAAQLSFFPWWLWKSIDIDLTTGQQL